MAGKSFINVTKRFTDFSKYVLVDEAFYTAADKAAENLAAAGSKEITRNVYAVNGVMKHRQSRQIDYFSACGACGVTAKPGMYMLHGEAYMAACNYYGLRPDLYIRREPKFAGLGTYERGKEKQEPKSADAQERILEELVLIRKACEMMVRKEAETNQKLLDVIGDQNAMHKTLKDFMGAYNGIGGHVGGDVGAIQKDVRDLGRLLTDKLGKVK